MVLHTSQFLIEHIFKNYNLNHFIWLNTWPFHRLFSQLVWTLCPYRNKPRVFPSCMLDRLWCKMIYSWFLKNDPSKHRDRNWFHTGTRTSRRLNLHSKSIFQTNGSYVRSYSYMILRSVEFWRQKWNNSAK